MHMHALVLKRTIRQKQYRTMFAKMKCKNSFILRLFLQSASSLLLLAAILTSVVKRNPGLWELWTMIRFPNQCIQNYTEKI